ncbi:SHOCT domain-containing protein [Clostridium estertheticum]|uniref:SHOCT domain-containing protein n=1 Tax=Clostridium estertheticum TaxID=238834 RepID=UPI001CD0486A|nr:SHOCT domain-containing protein [Clostridium estertheticum]MBZ9687033.1 SHOCT domain-containing protein [Clostridium estertheticum]
MMENGYSMIRNGYGYGYNMMGGWFGMMIIPIIIIGVIVFVVYNHGHNSDFKNTGVRNTSLDILNNRFAAGEINEEEYNRKKDLLLNAKTL